MRFMAIIAFCLIAILALVKEVEPVSKQTATPVLEVADAAADSKPTTESAPAPATPSPRPSAEVTQPADSWREPMPKPVDDVGRTEPTRKPDVAKRTPISEAAAVTKIASAAEPAQPTQSSPESISEETASEKEGLSLRFASDGDFLRLIARGDIKVYAFNDAGVLGLNNAYEFLSTRTPGKVYELLPQTIPSLIFDSLTRSTQQQGKRDGYNWGITLPGRIETQITSYLATARSGQLVIDRYGEVHHVAQN